MTENPELASLTIKDLRQLAGEHNVPNRSRLGKDELIDALKTALAARMESEPAAASAASATAPEPVAEPEVMDPESISDLTPLATPSLPGAEPEVLDSNAMAGLVPPLGNGEGEHRRRRRRRGRGRGRGRDGGGPPNQFLPGEGDDETDAEEGAGFQGQPAQGQAQPQRQQQPPHHQQPPPQSSQPRPMNDGRGPGYPPRGGNDPRGPRPPLPHPGQRQPDQRPQPPHQQQPQQTPGNQQQQPNRAPRPRLDGPQRPLPSVLDRLCTFIKGILELCDPSTPSWAQARLSELLAESGLVSLPATGLPHPDFHQVVGTIASRAVPTGHIAVIEAPGFALRGDRGDLFPLRKSQVRVAINQDRPASGPSDAPAASDHATPDAPPTITSETAETQEIPAPPAEPSVKPEGDGAGMPAGQAIVVDEGGSPPPPAPPASSDAVRADEAGDQREPSRAPRRDGPERAPRAQLAHGRGPAPQHFNRVTPASMAHPLPLVSQDADELAARPKAEGFRVLGLNDQILADVAAVGYTQPTPIQAEAIPVALSGKDMIGQAQTGTGKTAAFALPILQRLYTHTTQGPVALVLCPTRELARQVHNEIVKMSGQSGARAVVIYGGVPMDDQLDELAKNPHIVVGTPGRIIDHMRRHTLDLSRLAIAVLDEADQMLDIGFWPDVMHIISHTPPSRQSLLFSATMPAPVKLLAEKHMKDPVYIRISPKQVTVEEVDQKYIAVARDRKNELLAHFIETQNPEQLVVFCRTRHQTDRVAEVLKRKKMSVGAIHGDLPQAKRERILLQFRNRELQSLIATNVAARGLDIPSVSHVVNYDIPENPEEYVHRIGRTARMGARGVARTFITPEDGQFLLEIEKHIGLLLEEERIEGFTPAEITTEAKRTIADMPVGTPRMIKPLIGGIRLGRRRR